MPYKDLEKTKEYSKRWNKDNPEKNKTYRRKSYLKNIEKRKKGQQKYRKDNPEKIKAYRKKWTNENRDYKNFLNLQRLSKKKNAEGSHTFGEWELLKKQYGYRCLACGKYEPDIKLTEDHIIPLIRGGSDYIENIQPLCKICNSRKFTKIIKYVNS